MHDMCRIGGLLQNISLCNSPFLWGGHCDGSENEAFQGLGAGERQHCLFGGAGVSTESGIPDFRSTNGLYRQQYDYPPEEILSHTFFMKRPEEFFSFTALKCFA